ncbi:MAG: C-type lectin domain-containing protein [Sandaracinaceae bacterium]|nr:C-type lectin domain-containing protein [Sandaracinaceae bacterium]
MSRAAAALVLALVAPGCLLDRSGLGPGGADAGELDAASADAGAGRQDAGADDAGADDASAPDAAPPDACVPSPELCNGRDDDCDPTSLDGADEPWLDDACDADGDGCAGGRLACVEGTMRCEGDGPGSGGVDRCDGVDDDCNPATPDGTGDPRVGVACDGADADRCEGGTTFCFGGVVTCVGDDTDLPHRREVCNGIDDDCDPATLDGARDPMLGAACDDPADRDLCPGGTFICRDGALVCFGDDGDQPHEAELCDGVDNDCNPATVDGADDRRVGAPCDGPDTDQCLEGTGLCVGGAFSCTDTTGDSIETCNGRDDDCNGIVDDGPAGCPCTVRHREGNAYLFCNGFLERRSWTSARDWCRERGHDLVVIDDAAEQAWISANVGDTGQGYWIGYNDRAVEGTWVWSRAGVTTTFTNWNGGEPNNAGNEDCAVSTATNISAAGRAGGWNDVGCNGDQRFVCEAPR